MEPDGIVNIPRLRLVLCNKKTLNLIGFTYWLSKGSKLNFDGQNSGSCLGLVYIGDITYGTGATAAFCAVAPGVKTYCGELRDL